MQCPLQQEGRDEGIVTNVVNNFTWKCLLVCPWLFPSTSHIRCQSLLQSLCYQCLLSWWSQCAWSLLCCPAAVSIFNYVVSIILGCKKQENTKTAQGQCGLPAMLLTYKAPGKQNISDFNTKTAKFAFQSPSDRLRKMTDERSRLGKKRAACWIIRKSAMGGHDWRVFLTLHSQIIIGKYMPPQALSCASTDQSKGSVHLCLYASGRHSK